MARAEFSLRQLSNPSFVAEPTSGFYGTYSRAPGGLVAYWQFTPNAQNRIQIAPGTLLGVRAKTDWRWEPVVPAQTTNLSVPIAADITATDTTITLLDVSGFQDGDVVTIDDGTTSEGLLTIDTNGVDKLNKTLTFTAGTANGYLQATPTNVFLTTPVAQTFFQLTLSEVIDAGFNAEVGSFVQHGTGIHLERLPNQPLDPALITQIETDYKTIVGGF